MNDKTFLKGVFLVAVALFFGGTAVLRYPINDFTRVGPGLFPLLVSCLLFLVGVSTIVQSRFAERAVFQSGFRNIGIIVGSLCVFAILSEFVNMTVGIIAMVFLASVAGSSYSVVRNLKISAGLVAIAFAFAKLLGLNLPLY